MGKVKYPVPNESELQSVVDTGLSHLNLGKYYGVSVSVIKRWLDTYGLETVRTISARTDKFCKCCHAILENKSNTYCNNTCAAKLRRDEYIERWLNGLETGVVYGHGVASAVRFHLFKIHDSKCQRCYWGVVNKKTGNVPLQIHHVDGDAKNNSLENLELICPNCHSLTDTYGSLNRNSSRTERYKN